MQLSIIIVNYRTPALVLDCLRTLYAHTRDTVFEVIVADNGSGDDSRGSIKGAYPAVRWIDMGYNAGFARANNAAIRQSLGETILLLNSDTLMEENAIGSCHERLVASEYIAAGIQLLNKDRTSQISGLFNMRGGISQLLLLPVLGTVFRVLGKSFRVTKPHLAGDRMPHRRIPDDQRRPNDHPPGNPLPHGDVRDSSSPIEVDWISGAFLMVKKTAIEKAGLMDEDFFLYAEEAEWCGRLQKTGKLCIFGDLNAIHLEGETVNKESGSSTRKDHHVYDRKGLQFMLSGFLRIRKQYGVFWLLAILFFYLAEIPLFFLGVLITGAFTKKDSELGFRHLGGYIRNVFVILGVTGRMIRNKPYFYKVL
jgi:GT2 family glycosyltransferase